MLVVESVGSDDALFSIDPLGNEVVGDDNNSARTTIINVFNTMGVERLDRRVCALPADFFDKTLETARVVDDGATFVRRALVFGLTVEAPTPGSAGRLLVAGAVGVRRWR